MTDKEPIFVSEGNRDVELEKIIGSLLVAEYQMNKLNRMLTDRLDPYNPSAFSKEHSDFTFNRAGKSYRVSVRVDRADFKEKTSIDSKHMLPALGVVASLFLAALIAIIMGGTYSNAQLQSVLPEDSAALILERCTKSGMLDNPNPRMFAGSYAVCEKQIKQLQEFCKTRSAEVCMDERIDEYLRARKLV